MLDRRQAELGRRSAREAIITSCLRHRRVKISASHCRAQGLRLQGLYGRPLPNEKRRSHAVVDKLQPAENCLIAGQRNTVGTLPVTDEGV